eukprot:scaffold616_cov257-Pinguiococcus_pyrenoidosus.AAC.17
MPSKMLSLMLLPVAARAFVTAPPRPALRLSNRVTARRFKAVPTMIFGRIQEALEPTPTSTEAPVTAREVRAAQANWAASIKKISAACLNKEDFVSVAGEAAGELYAYGHSNVLFKPTKCKDVQFRPMATDAMSYFVGAKNVEAGGIPEDKGFAINGGKGWSDVVFDNHKIELNGPTAIAMGNYYFTCATTGDKSKVEYTFGYKRCDDGKVRIFLHHSSVPFNPIPVDSPESPEAITEAEVREAQQTWADNIKKISTAYLKKKDFKAVAGEAAGELYAYGHASVLFKPTKARDVQFRPMAADAMSYFVGAENVEEGAIAEDGGFAINGGKGWSDVVFDNHQIDLNGGTAVAMGNYYFTCATTGDKTKVEYTFGYKRCADNKIRIFLHHSSVPFAPEGKPVTKEEVIAVQTAWANAIKKISSVHKQGGDFIGAASDAAGELYSYGRSNVLFKPTKAAEYQFRPTASSAMSYFVGGKEFDDGYEEDGGFAINGGKGWADCVYDNHQVEVKGDIAIAMGNYYFTCATSGEVSKVEYTFGYERCDDDKVRIFLHHSSVPYPMPATTSAAKKEKLNELVKQKV